jgi:diaminopimelate decarboxylase
MGEMITSNPTSHRLGLFPVTTQIEHEPGSSYLSIAGHDLRELAHQHGTPLYVYDQATIEQNLAQYQHALAVYPGTTQLTYAGKAFLCRWMARWASSHGMSVDCTGVGEIAIAIAAGIPSQSILVHGVNKSSADLSAALENAGVIVIDNLAELNRLSSIYRKSDGETYPEFWLRFRPGTAVDTHAYRQTGQIQSKFGMDAEEIHLAVKICLDAGIPVTGLHFHQGSHFHDPSPLQQAIQASLDLLYRLKQELGWYPKSYCPGGGWGVSYHEDDLPHPPVDTYVAYIVQALTRGCESLQLDLPNLVLEPGRSLVARAGVAIYQVGAIKNAGGRRWLLLDGGMADNPRPALYGVRYSALPVYQPDRPASYPSWFGGPYCESGDVLIENLLMPDIGPGEWVAVPASGAYQLSMSSNYNGARRPAVLWLTSGEERLIQRRETLQDLHQRDL